MPKLPDKKLIGRWQGTPGIIELRADCSAAANGEEGVYVVEDGVITLIAASGTFQFPYRVTKSGLILMMNGQAVNFHCVPEERAPKKAASRATAGELVGTWSYLGGSTTYAGSTMSTAQLTLNADGTYEYASEYSASGEAYAAGYSLASENSDRGTWSATATTLTLRSAKQGNRTFVLEKINHPQNGDPMIVLDGQAYVTLYQRSGWR